MPERFAKSAAAAKDSACTQKYLSPSQIEAVQQLAKKVYTVLGCKGYARVDVFLTDNGKWVVNEVNTLPGFTDISLYSKNWQNSGVDTLSLLERLIQLAGDEYEHQRDLRQKTITHLPQIKQVEKSS